MPSGKNDDPGASHGNYMDSSERTTVKARQLSADPHTATTLVVGRPNIGDRQRFLDRVEDILDRRWLSNDGKYVQEFEHRVADFVGVRHCIAMCNATVGLEITIRALELRGEVIVPSFTFIATAHALQWQGITPIFCDVDPETHNIDPSLIDKLITSRTTGILAVDLWGRACDVESLERIARKRDLRLIYDASHAFGCSYREKMIGGFGDAEIFSFHATKFINTLEGGVVTTNNASLAATIRRMRNFGFTDYDRVDCLGINGKMDEISAAMGLTNLDAMDEFIAANRRNYEAYREELGGHPALELLSYDDREKCNYQYIVVTVDEEAAGVSRDEIVRELHNHNILARRYFFPGCHRHEPYHSQARNADIPLPQTEKLAAKILCLPTGSTVGPPDIKRVCEIIRKLLARVPVR
jgi:dTDP-4-amino-4,6-dideoxygalactose transaminase